MKKSGISLILLIAIMVLLMGYTHSFAANYALEIIQPRAGLNTTNRFYKAYPGLEYNVRVAVIGGAYPFTYSLTTAPSGMTINANTGEITWPNPTTINSHHSVSVSVTDQESSTTSVSWTITVTTSGFRFIDAVNGQTVANGGTGTISNPWKTIADMYEGNDYAAKSRRSYANEFLYFRLGTYQMDAYTEDGGRLPLVAYNKPIVWMAYPGEKPILDMGIAHITAYSGSDNMYIDGFSITNFTNPWSKGFQIDSNANNVTFRRNTFYNLPATSGSNNQSCIMRSRSGVGSYFSVQDNTFYDIHHGYAVLGYESSKVLIENNTLHDFNEGGLGYSTHGIGPKESNFYWFIRWNYSYNMNTAGSIWIDTFTLSSDIEISFNRFIDSGMPFLIGLDGPNYGRVYSYRNTYVGGEVVVMNLTNTGGPVSFAYDIIVNELTTSDHIRGINNTSLPDRIIRTNNLSGYSSHNIVDSNGNLTPAYSSYLGTHGYQIDATAPYLEIIQPTKDNTYSTTASSINLSGTATDTVGIVSVTWSNDRGGSGTAWSGTATQNVNWTVSNIPLQSSQNIITITATDGDGKTATDILVVTLTTSGGGGDTGGNTGGGSGDVSASGGSGCGFVKDDGKGQKAKGEGLAFAMMLIITLAGTALLKKGRGYEKRK